MCKVASDLINLLPGDAGVGWSNGNQLAMIKWQRNGQDVPLPCSGTCIRIPEKIMDVSPPPAVCCLAWHSSRRVWVCLTHTHKMRGGGGIKEASQGSEIQRIRIELFTNKLYLQANTFRPANLTCVCSALDTAGLHFKEKTLQIINL